MANLEIVRKLCEQQGKDMSEDEKKYVVARESEIFDKEGLPHVEPIGIVTDLIAEGRRKGLKMAVVSGGQRDIVDNALTDFKLADAFQV